MKLEKKTTRKLSIAVGLLSFAAFIIQGARRYLGLRSSG